MPKRKRPYARAAEALVEHIGDELFKLYGIAEDLERVSEKTADKRDKYFMLGLAVALKRSHKGFEHELNTFVREFCGKGE